MRYRFQIEAIPHRSKVSPLIGKDAGGPRKIEIGDQDRYPKWPSKGGRDAIKLLARQSAVEICSSSTPSRP
jgi:hypothetical protein